MVEKAILILIGLFAVSGWIIGMIGCLEEQISKSKAVVAVLTIAYSFFLLRVYEFFKEQGWL